MTWIVNVCHSLDDVSFLILILLLNPNIKYITSNFSPEYAKYSSDEEEDEEEVLGEPFVKEREIDEQEMDKVMSYIVSTHNVIIGVRIAHSLVLNADHNPMC